MSQIPNLFSLCINHLFIMNHPDTLNQIQQIKQKRPRRCSICKLFTHDKRTHHKYNVNYAGIDPLQTARPPQWIFNELNKHLTPNLVSTMPLKLRRELGQIFGATFVGVHVSEHQNQLIFDTYQYIVNHKKLNLTPNFTQSRQLQVKEIPEDRCVVCFENLNKHSAQTSCNHHFCTKCLLELFTYKNACPVCRKPFVSKSVDLLITRKYGNDLLFT